METKEISKAIIEVMKSVKGMEKNSQVGYGNHGYKGTKDQDVKEVFNDALSSNGLCIIPTAIEEDTQIYRWVEEDNRNKKQKQSIFTKVKTKYLLLHTSGENVELVGYGHGVDTQDKGSGKATTYALKNCLLYTFLTPVGKIDDTDTTNSQEIEIPASNPSNKKEELTPVHPRWIGAINAIIEEKTTIEEIKKTMSLSKDNETLLSREATK